MQMDGVGFHMVNNEENSTIKGCASRAHAAVSMSANTFGSKRGFSVRREHVCSFIC
jgi:hypothetical protein